MFKRALTTVFLLVAASFAQQQAAPQATPQSSEGKPQVKVNYLNVCTPGTDEQAILKNALAAIQAKPSFGTDFELSRGRTTMKDAPDAKYVRLRRDFAAEAALVTAQYSISTDNANTTEVLVLHSRDPKEFLEVVLESRVSAGSTSPLAILQVDTPVSRIRVERLNKSSAVLTRCEDADQSSYEPLFHEASDIMARYRSALGLRTAFRSDIAWLNSESRSSAAPKKKPAATKH